jgi:hypothetical protein
MIRQPSLPSFDAAAPLPRLSPHQPRLIAAMPPAAATTIVAERGAVKDARVTPILCARPRAARCFRPLDA